MPTSVPLAPDAEVLRDLGRAAGLDRVGFASAVAFPDVRDLLVRRRAEGRHGGMAFTYRNPERSADPARILASARTLVVGARAYPSAPAAVPADLRARGPLARVARYATADHYAALRAGLDVIADRLRADGWQARVVADDNALVDRAAAHRSGIGWYGKNASILIDGVGSWFVLGSVVTDAPIPVHTEPTAPAAGCGSCTRCLDRCPTGAIVEPGVVDARRCLAWLVQAEGPFPVEHRVALGDRLYGCDECQEVCPPAARTARLEHDPPGRAAPAGEPAEPGAPGEPAERLDERGHRSDAPGAWVAVLDLLAASDADLLDRFGRWYIPRREPRYLRRNALVVVGNAAAVPATPDVIQVLARYVADPDPILRGPALWAARRLGLTQLVPAPDQDPDAGIRAELAAEVPVRAGSSGPPSPPSRGADHR